MMKKIIFGGLAMALAVAAETNPAAAQQPPERERRMKKEKEDDQGPQKHSTGRTAPAGHQEAPQGHSTGRNAPNSKSDQQGKKKGEAKRTSHNNDDQFEEHEYTIEYPMDEHEYTIEYPMDEHVYGGGSGGKESKKGGGHDDYLYDDYYYDDYIYGGKGSDVDDYYYGGKGAGKGSGYYDDYYMDDYYYGKGKGKGGKKSSKKGSKKGGKGYYPSDDLIWGDDDYFSPGAPRATVPLVGEATSPVALLSVVPDTTSPDPFAVGTVYPFGNVTYNPTNREVELIDLSLDGALVQLQVRLDGYCTRTGTADNTVEGYCHFTYTVDDPTSFVTLGSFTAEGPLTNPNMMIDTPCSSLQVTGGTGLFTAATGLIAFCPSIYNEDIDLIESLPVGEDLFEDVDAYLHIIDMLLDEEFLYLTSSA